MNDKLTPQQERVIKLLFKFRFVTAKLLAQVLGIRPDSTYVVLEHLVKLGYVTKKYDPNWRIDRRPAFYYLNHAGVRAARSLLGVTEPAVHALYKNDTASPTFIDFCLAALSCYSPIKQSLPSGTELFSKSELARYKQFPKNRPDLYIRTPEKHEAIVVFAQDMTVDTMKKRLNELVDHSEEDEWSGKYPIIAFVLSSANAKHTFLYRTALMVESMGIDEEDLMLKAADIHAILENQGSPWSSVYKPKQLTSLL